MNANNDAYHHAQNAIKKLEKLTKDGEDRKARLALAMAALLGISSTVAFVPGKAEEENAIVSLVEGAAGAMALATGFDSDVTEFTSLIITIAAVSPAEAAAMAVVVVLSYLEWVGLSRQESIALSLGAAQMAGLIDVSDVASHLPDDED